MTLNKDFENEQIKLLNGGNKIAFSYFFSKYRDQVYFYCLSFVKEAEIAEDITQDVFMNVWEKRELIDSGYPFSAFLYTIVRHHVLDTIRSAGIRLKVHQMLLSHAIDYVDGPEQQMNEKMIHEAVHDAIEQLTPRQKEVFILSREYGLPNKAIADKLGISLYTVQDHIKASLESIRKYFICKYGTNGFLLFVFLVTININ